MGRTRKLRRIRRRLSLLPPQKRTAEFRRLFKIKERLKEVHRG